MRRRIRQGSILVLVLGSCVAASCKGWSQEITPKTLIAPPGLGQLAKDLAVQAAELARELGEAPATTDAHRALLSDARELSVAATEFRDILRRDPERFLLRRSFAGIDHAWHDLQARLPGNPDAAAQIRPLVDQIGKIDGEIHRIWDVNALPPTYYQTNAPAPSRMSEVQRLGHALADRAEALAAVIGSDLRGQPGWEPLYQRALSLARVVDDFHDALDLNANIQVARNGFAGVAAGADSLIASLRQVPLTPRIRRAWLSFRTTEALLRQNLGLPTRLDPPLAGALPTPEQPNFVQLADRLIEQANAFLSNFTPRAKDVPEGGEFIADARRLQAAVTDFRRDAEGGFLPDQLAARYVPVDLCWQRLARRTNRIAQGRTGPYVQALASIGETTTEIHRLLGLPGYPPTILTAAPTP